MTEGCGGGGRRLHRALRGGPAPGPSVVGTTVGRINQPRKRRMELHLWWPSSGFGPWLNPVPTVDLREVV